MRFSGNKRTVIDGPFAETKELVAGFWIWQVKSLQEAIDWVKRCPNPMPGESEIEIRQIFEAEDFGAAFTPELREQEERLRAKVAASNPGRRPAALSAPGIGGATRGRLSRSSRRWAGARQMPVQTMGVTDRASQ